MKTARFQAFTILVLGIFLGAALQALFFSTQRSAIAQTRTAAPTLETLAAEIETIKGKLPDQSHAMEDVSHHFANLWFAAQQENWPLANFYSTETRSHLRWAVRIIPKRKDSVGREVDLQAILQAFENGPWKQLQDAIAGQRQKQPSRRPTASRWKLVTLATERRKTVPSTANSRAPENPIINFDPSASGRNELAVQISHCASYGFPNRKLPNAIWIVIREPRVAGPHDAGFIFSHVGFCQVGFRG